MNDKHAQKSPVPVERDFTAGVAGRRRSFVGSTGDPGLDLEIASLAGRVAGDRTRAELVAEMMTTAARIGRDGVKTGDFKLMNRALKEMRAAEEVFAPWKDYRKVSVFGSARAPRDQPEYRAAVELAAKLREHGFMTITGAGPGIMAAGNEGAGAGDSFGLNISLPFEAEPNEFIAGDPKLIDFNYFFTRKLSFVKESDAAVGFPGGFGTMDEVFEAMTLIQTGKAGVYPLVLVDVGGGTYWKFWEQFIVDHLLRNGLISEADLALFRVTDDLDAAVEEIVGFYRIFHSYRYVGDRLVVRLLKRLSAHGRRAGGRLRRSAGVGRDDPAGGAGGRGRRARIGRLAAAGVSPSQREFRAFAGIHRRDQSRRRRVNRGQGEERSWR